MNAMVEQARKDAALMGDIARAKYGTPEYPTFKRAWLIKVDELNACLRGAQRAIEERREANERK